MLEFMPQSGNTQMPVLSDDSTRAKTPVHSPKADNLTDNQTTATKSDDSLLQEGSSSNLCVTVDLPLEIKGTS